MTVYHGLLAKPREGTLTQAVNPKQSEPLARSQRLMLDVKTERSNAQLRLGAAGLSLLGGGWLAWVERGQSGWLSLVALVSLFFSARWVVAYRKLKGIESTILAHYLEITPERVTLAEGTHHRSIPLERIHAVELDHDRLAVVLRLHTGDQLVIEPMYGGLGLQELGELLARHIASRTEPCDRRDPLRAQTEAGCTDLEP